MIRSLSPRWVYLAAFALAAGIVFGAWSARDRFQPLGPGMRAPDFSYPDLEGVATTLSEHRGKVVVVNLWATWCPPCRTEMPSMERVYRQLRPQGFEILAVSVDRPIGEADSGGRIGGNIGAFADSLGLTFPILHDPSGRIQQSYQSYALPESYIIGRDGTILQKVIGGTEWDEGMMWETLQRLVER